VLSGEVELLVERLSELGDAVDEVEGEDATQRGREHEISGRTARAAPNAPPHGSSRSTPGPAIALRR